MTYLDSLPRCPHCNRILRTRNDRPWCIDCKRFADNPTTFKIQCTCGTGLTSPHSWADVTRLWLDHIDSPACNPGNPRPTTWTFDDDREGDQ